MIFYSWALTTGIKVSHCSCCHSDIHLVDDDRGISRYLLVPGREIVGTDTETRAAVENPRGGDRVGVGWQTGSCLRCEWCLNGCENLCQARILTCVRPYGGFADFVRTDSRFAFPIPNRSIPTMQRRYCAQALLYTHQ
jgi:uncharacterized zinc-type alcohol dehydrogenase-like protein